MYSNLYKRKYLLGHLKKICFFFMKSKKLLSFKQDLIENSAFMTNEFITSASNSFFSSL